MIHMHRYQDLSNKTKRLILISLFFVLFSLMFIPYVKRDILSVTPPQLDHTDVSIKEDMQTQDDDQKEHLKEANMIYIDLKGAVSRPNLYQVAADSILYDVIQQAGGLSEQADPSAINFALRLQDQMVIYIPTKNEVVPDHLKAVIPWKSSLSAETSKANTPDQTQTTSSELISLNQATADQLQTLEGIGPKKAQAIVSYREEHGPFPSIDSLTEVPGIGETTLQRIKDQITL